MPQNVITNPAGVYTTVTDFRTGRDESGVPLSYPQQIDYLRANATITRGQALMDVVPTQTVPLSVTPMTAAITASDPWKFVGVALADAVAGDFVPVCVRGYCEVLFDTASTAAADSLLLAPGTTTGDFDIKTAAVAADAVVGKVLGPEISTTDRCFAYVGWVAVPTVVDTT
jgi:hypothetical protein